MTSREPGSKPFSAAQACGWICSETLMRTFTGRGIVVPIGLAFPEPIMPISTMGAPVAMATRAMPVRPLYTRPSGDRVPSG